MIPTLLLSVCFLVYRFILHFCVNVEAEVSYFRPFLFSVQLYFISFLLLGMEPKALHLLGKLSTIELHL